MQKDSLLYPRIAKNIRVSALVNVRVLLSILLINVANTAVAVDTIGPVYPIIEPDMAQEMVKNLQEQEKKGILQRKQKESIDRSKRSMEEPPPVQGLRRTSKARSFYYDPTVIANEDVLDSEGKVVVMAGTRANPLDYVAMPQHLLFFDGRDRDQVAMAKAIDTHYDGRVKLIMTAGRVLDQTRKWKKQVYFDQGGFLTARFAIQQVPALVYQEGRLLRIDEMEVRK